jgi:peptide chain release factor 2
LRNSNASTFRSASRQTLCGAIFDASSKQTEVEKLEQQIAAPDFWNDKATSQRVLQERKRLERTLGEDQEVVALTEEIDTLFELAREGEDVLEDISGQLPDFSAHIEKLETAMLLAGENDLLSAIVTIHPGAGGTESQDWAEMLFRMYLRWAERNEFKTVITDRQDGEAAGIKSATFEVNGDAAYGLLQSEVGVHRLVRISPYDSAARRHTSFASVFVYPQVDDSIEIEIKSDDIRVDTYCASGAGGQHVNRTFSAIRMTHIPTNIVVQCQNERSQHKNRSSAMKQLKARLYEHEMAKKRAEQDEVENSKAAINFGSQIRSYVLAPYRMVKDVRTRLSKGNVDSVLEGDIDSLIHAYLVWRKTGKTFGDDKDTPDE